MKITQTKLIIITVLLLVAACAVAVVFHLFTSRDLWYEMFAAILGVIITAIITVVLLQGQTSSEVKREREIKIFEKKLAIYQDYLSKLREIIEDREISDKEKTELEFQTSYIAMHCATEHLVTISAAVQQIIQSACGDKSVADAADSPDNSGGSDLMLAQLFIIVEAFRKDLYGTMTENMDKNMQKSILENFSNAYRYDQEDHSDAPAPTLDEVQTENTGSPFRLWEEAKAKWTAEGWSVNDQIAANNGLGIRRDNTPCGIVIDSWGEGNYIRAYYDNDVDFSKPMKWKKGGRRYGGAWWQYLPASYKTLSREEFADTLRTYKLQQYLIEAIEEQMQALLKHHRSTIWKQALQSRLSADNQWKVFIWYWKMLSCQLQDDAQGVPYIDTFEEEQGQISFRLSNRQNDTEKLKKTLQKIGSNTTIDDKGFAILGTYTLTDDTAKDATEIASRLADYLSKIEN